MKQWHGGTLPAKPHVSRLHMMGDLVKALHLKFRHMRVHSTIIDSIGLGGK